MTNVQYDGVIEAIRYTPDGKVALARAYERRGPAFSDRILLNRNELIQRLNSGEKFMIGKRLSGMEGTFEVYSGVKLVKDKDNIEWIHSGQFDQPSERDVLEGAPLF